MRPLVTGYVTIPAPSPEPYRYGLLAAASAATGTIDSPHWQLGVQFDTDSCATGGVWDSRCGDPFTVTLTRTATDDPNFAVTVSVGTFTDYTISYDGGPAIELSDELIVPGPVSVVEVCEVAGLRRCVTFPAVDINAAQGTVYTQTSSAQAANDPKTALGLQTGTADAFTVYAGVDCRIVGLLDAGAKARRRLAAVEQRLVEQRVWEQQIAIPSAILATGSATAVSLKAGIAALEQVLGDNYGGIGIIHSPEWVTPYLADRYQLWPDNPRIRTGLGTKWAFGRGYGNAAPDGTPAEANTVWLYATGDATYLRSDVFVPADVETGATNLTLNDALVIAERTYAVALDCPLYAVHITLEGE